MNLYKPPKQIKIASGKECASAANRIGPDARRGAVAGARHPSTASEVCRITIDSVRGASVLTRRGPPHPWRSLVKKLKLNVEELAVDSFDLAPVDEARGTVHGAS